MPGKATQAMAAPPAAPPPPESPQIFGAPIEAIVHRLQIVIGEQTVYTQALMLRLEAAHGQLQALATQLAAARARRRPRRGARRPR